MIEELLFALSAVKHPDALKSADLSFYKMASIAKAMFSEEHTGLVWDADFELNALRNALAHNLELPDLDSRLRRFGRAGSGGSAEAEDMVVSDPQRVMAESIQVMCGVLIGHIGSRTSGGAA